MSMGSTTAYRAHINNAGVDKTSWNCTTVLNRAQCNQIVVICMHNSTHNTLSHVHYVLTWCNILETVELFPLGTNSTRLICTSVNSLLKNSDVVFH